MPVIEYSMLIGNGREWCRIFHLPGLSSRTKNFRADVHLSNFTNKELQQRVGE
jgi:hypothetical protein